MVLAAKPNPIPERGTIVVRQIVEHPRQKGVQSNMHLAGPLEEGCLITTLELVAVAVKLTFQQWQ